MSKVYVARRVPITVARWQERYGWSREDAEKMVRDDPNVTETRVYVAEADDHNGELTGDAYELPHYVHHSPDGFEWGYGGSGPAELARCILADHFGFVANEGGGWIDANGEAHPTLPVDYQQFKQALIGTQPVPGFSVPEAVVAAWVGEYRMARA